jgi:hypothetical protein
MTTLYTVHSPEGVFLMKAPMMVIAAAFNLRREAVQRVVAETKLNQISSVHFNGRPSLLNLAEIKIEMVLSNKELAAADRVAVAKLYGETK